MPWIVEGTGIENCTCRHFCICNIGAEPDGKHAQACVYVIRKGQSDGIDLSGTVVVQTYQLPSGFAQGNGTGRTYISDTATAAQRKELDAIFNGERGGAFTFARTTVSTLLPTLTARISVKSDDNAVFVKIGDIAEVTARRLRSASGKQTVLGNAVYLEPVGIAYEDLCDATGSYWSDRDMPKWRSGGGGGLVSFKIGSEQTL